MKLNKDLISMNDKYTKSINKDFDKTFSYECLSRQIKPMELKIPKIELDKYKEANMKFKVKRYKIAYS